MTVSSSIFSFKTFRLVLVCCLCFAAFELLMRWRNFGSRGILYFWEYSSIWPININTPDEDRFKIGYRLRSNLDLIHLGKSFKTNSYGFREREIPIDKPEDMKRIAVVGRSFTMGPGCDNKEIYSRRLENYFISGGRPDVQVLNFSVGGYRLPQVAALYERDVKKFNPDLVLFPILYSEISSSENIRANLMLRDYTSLETYLGYTFSYRTIRRFFQNEITTDLSNDWRTRDRPSREHRKIKNSRLLSAFIQARKAEGVQVVIVALRRLKAFEPGNDGWHKKKLENFVEQHPGVVLIDLQEKLKGKTNLDRDRIYYGNGHPKPRVHNLYAQGIYEDLKSHSGLERLD